MTRRAASQTTSTKMPASNPFLGAGMNPFLYLVRMQAGNMKAMLKWQTEAMDFVRHRYEQDMKFIDELVQSPEPGEVLSAYSCFLQNALDEYSQEAVKVANLSAKTITESAKDVRQQAEAVSSELMVANVAQ